ncbi:hypothetical protein B481_2720 [Planococcus halocryophilus Or1]|uniref:Protein phosphatase n=1 Tax=Planococcus halocryophilus TaxID=1215089 RepID=A0A1C7DPU7_9BACL|nr:protein phosphatase 2C domain-containing protein [Planococcus halocryophilus]ANU13301.1 protein phosphatase [Planococcus halocryophilus]EMF45877.1 hypothetical protein B481_2720 [Planococcus halocryophilus Or1]
MSNGLHNNEFSWVGSQSHYVDEIDVRQIQHVTIGRFGGNSTAGQYKNEDACLVWTNEKEDWEFVVLLDAHQSAESAELVISTVNVLKGVIQKKLKLPTKQAFEQTAETLLMTFESSDFKESCRKVQGETAVLCVVRKGKFLWWLSIGDCLLYLFHPELVALNETQQNHRSFYEWVGQVNTFELPVPCYSVGTKELRKGKNQILLTTDGLVECPNTNFGDPNEVKKPFETLSNKQGVLALLEEIKEKNVRDSTTILSWFINVDADSTRPSNG